MSVVMQPVLDHAAVERARLVNAARVELLGSGGAITVEMLADATGRTPGAARQWLHRHRSAGRLITVNHDGVALIPTFQLTEAFDLDLGVAELVARLTGHDMSGWAVWDWFQTPNTWLDGRNPSEVIAEGDNTSLHHAISGLFQE